MNQLTNKNVYIYGAGVYGERALIYSKDKFNVTAFVDQRADNGFVEYHSKPVISRSELLSITEDIVVIIAMRYPSEILKYLIGALNIQLYIFDGSNTENLFLYKVENSEICSSEYFDKVYTEWKPYSEHYSKQDPFILNVFNKALESIKILKKDSKIIEIGCGSGLFANMLFDNGYTNYLGIDFSLQAINLAKKANAVYEEHFICDNAFEFLNTYSEMDNSVFIIFEVLEHINNDIDLLELIPANSKIIFSVPNFKSFNHLRTFNDLDEIEKRYTMLKINSYYELPSKIDGYVYHLCEAVKKENIINE